MSRLVMIWAMLVAATLVSTIVDIGWRSGGDFAVAAILVIAAIKIRFVGFDYMEIRHAPMPLRIAFEGWLVLITIALIAMMAFGPALLGPGGVLAQ